MKKLWTNLVWDQNIHCNSNCIVFSRCLRCSGPLESAKVTVGHCVRAYDGSQSLETAGSKEVLTNCRSWWPMKTFNSLLKNLTWNEFWSIIAVFVAPTIFKFDFDYTVTCRVLVYTSTPPAYGWWLMKLTTFNHFLDYERQGFRPGEGDRVK